MNLNFFLVSLLIPSYQWITVEGECTNNKTYSSLFVCPSGYHSKMGKRICYKPIFKKLPQTEATKYCAENDSSASLLTIADGGISKELYETIWKYIYFDQGVVPFWIGLNDRETEGEYEWQRCADGKVNSGSFADWVREDRGIVLPVDEKHIHNCVTWVYSQKKHGWKIQNCKDTFYFICQIHLHPLTTLTPSNATEPQTSPFQAPTISVANIAFISVISAIIISLAAFFISFFLYKSHIQRKRITLLRTTGIFPSVLSKPVGVRRTAFEISISPKQY